MPTTQALAPEAADSVPASLLKILLLALSYVISGQLAMLLAVPPGYVSAIFPPVGISLAAVLMWGYPMLFGVFFGSTLLNLSISLGSLSALATTPLSAAQLLVPCSIALGTTLQCCCASWAIKRWIGFPNPLTDDKQIFWLLVIGGPLSCLLSASAGIAVLYQHQIISASQLLFSWWSWWVGDSIGVLIATPLMFIVFAKPRDIWRSRITSVGLPLLISCALMVVLFFRTIEDEQSQLQQRFHEQAKLMAQSIQSRLVLYTSSVMPIERFFAASGEVTATDFAIFVSATARNHPGIRALSWNPKITSAERPWFEARLQAEVPGQQQMTERGSNNQLLAAAPRPTYFPIYFIEPKADNLTAIGYDAASEPVRRKAMQSASDTGHATLTAPLQLVQDNKQQIGMLLFYPVFQTAQWPATASERQQLLRGYVVAALHMTAVIQSALAAYPEHSFQLVVNDISDGTAQPLYHKQQSATPAYARSLIWQQEFDLAGRRFSMHIAPSDWFLKSQSSLQPWAILTAGLLLCGLLGGFLLSVTGRAEQVRRQVKLRTLELTGILNNAAEAILIFNSDGTIERANIAAQQLFGYNNNQLLKLQIAALLPQLQLNNEAELTKAQGRAIEAVGNSAAGVTLQLEISLSSYSLPGHTWFICLLHDISERKKIARLKSEFVATVSHELRTPLTSIKGALDLVNAGVLGTLPEAAGNMLRLAGKNTELLELLVNDILDIEKLELAEASLVLSPLNLAEQLQLALQQNQSYATSYAVTLCLDMEQLPATTRVMAHNQRLQQVFSNLISNAVKFSPAQSQVQIKARLQGQQAIVSFSDQGPGIAEEFRSRIFQKFAQADGSDTRQRGGTGLGLSICKALMEKMHGSIGFDSIEGKGSTFFIILPLVDEEPIAPTTDG